MRLLYKGVIIVLLRPTLVVNFYIIFVGKEKWLKLILMKRKSCLERLIQNLILPISPPYNLICNTAVLRRYQPHK